MPVVLEAVPFGAAGRQRQHGIKSVERLNGRFLVHREDRGVVWRIDVETDHVSGLGFEIGIIRLHVPLESVGLEAGTLPGLCDEVVMNPQRASQLPRTPVRAAIRRRLLRPGQHAGFHLRRQHGRRLAAVARPQPVEPVRHEASAPPIDVIAVARHRGLDGRVRVSIRQHQNHASPSRVFRPNLETSHAALQLRSFIVRQCQRHGAPEYSTASVSTSH